MVLELNFLIYNVIVQLKVMEGYHFSIEGDIYKIMKKYIKKYPTGQIYISNPQQLTGKDITKRLSVGKVHAIRELVLKNNFKLFIHANYLINTARPNKKAINSLLTELKSGKELGATGVVFHVGKGGTINDMIKTIISIIKQMPVNGPMLLLESSAGIRGELGSNIDLFADIFNKIITILPKAHFGVCIDTAHLHSSGIDLSTPKAVKMFIKEFHEKVGWKHVKLIHFNDSKCARGSKVDRHESIGLGVVTKTKEGMKGFKLISKLAKELRIPLIFEFKKYLESI